MKASISCLFVCLSFIISCQSESLKKLDCAEALLQQSPDSSLYMLQGMSVNEFHKEKDKARYALIKSAALDKNYYDVNSDSLTRIALDYYSFHPDRYYRMLAWYYHGLVLMNAHSYSSSIVALEKAESDAEYLNDALYSGLIMRNKAKVFCLTNNNPAAIECQRKAVRCFELAEKDSYKSFAETDLAIYYTNNRDFEKADSLFNYIRHTYDNPVLTRYCDLCQAGITVELNRNPEEAISLYRGVQKSFYGILNYAYLALAYERLQHRDSADFWLAEGYRFAKNQADSATLDYPRSHLESMRGHYQYAFHLVDHAATVQDSLTRVLLEQSVSAAQRDYYKTATLLQEEKIHSMRQKVVFGSLLSLLLISLSIMTIVIVFRKKDRQLQDQMARLALEEKEIERVTKDNAHLVGSLFSEKIDHLDKLTESYFKMEDGREKERIFKQVKQLVSSIRNDEGLFLSLEKDLNRYCNDIMSKLREQVPRIKDENLQIITLFFAGLPYETVRLIMNKVSVESLKMARSRFRKDIKDSGAPDAEFFLKMLEMKRRPQADTNESGDC